MSGRATATTLRVTSSLAQCCVHKESEHGTISVSASGGRARGQQAHFLAPLITRSGYGLRALHEEPVRYTTVGAVMSGMLDHDPYPSIRDGVPNFAMDGWVYGLRGDEIEALERAVTCLLYTSPSPRDATLSRMPSSA